ncbi:unnamed protein product [Polarella glacialis]|uniref:Sucrose transporter n=1 Tax=Polarella glacialis TaxID=89957 RepID=A0A813KFJ5_POLGL|nr:unnamed protein product [Polarella glacialis]
MRPGPIHNYPQPCQKAPGNDMGFGPVVGGTKARPRRASDDQQAWTSAQLLALAASHGGVSLGFGLQYALLTPFVMELGVPKRWASFLWLGGPLTGMLVQPLVGKLSDSYRGRWAHFGRRRPFIVGSTLVTALTSIVVGNCVDLGVLIGDAPQSAVRVHAAVLFTLGFWALDAGNNGVIVSSRALLVDVVPGAQRLQAFSAATLASGLGLALGYLVGGLPLSNLPGLRQLVCTQACGAAGGCADIRVAFIVALLVVVASTACTVSIGHEAPVKVTEDDDDEESRKLVSRNQDARSVIGVILGDRVILAVFCVSLLTWFGWIATQIFQSHFLAEEIYGGSPDQSSARNSLYVDGMRAASLSLVVNALLMSASTMSFEAVRARLGDRGLWMLGLESTSFLLGLSILVRATKSRPAAWLWLASLGPPYAIQLTLPYTILGSRAPQELQGQLQGYLNVAVCFPQLVLSLFGGQIVAWAGSDTVLFAFGSVVNFFAAIVCWRLLRPGDGFDHSEKTPLQAPAAHPLGKGFPGIQSEVIRKRGIDIIQNKGEMLDL